MILSNIIFAVIASNAEETTQTSLLVKVNTVKWFLQEEFDN
jgi:hypothetical protein